MAVVVMAVVVLMVMEHSREEKKAAAEERKEEAQTVLGNRGRVVKERERGRKTGEMFCSLSLFTPIASSFHQHIQRTCKARGPPRRREVREGKVRQKETEGKREREGEPVRAVSIILFLLLLLLSLKDASHRRRSMLRSRLVQQVSVCLSVCLTVVIFSLSVYLSLCFFACLFVCCCQGGPDTQTETVCSECRRVLTVSTGAHLYCCRAQMLMLLLLAAR